MLPGRYRPHSFSGLQVSSSDFPNISVKALFYFWMFQITPTPFIIYRTRKTGLSFIALFQTSPGDLSIEILVACQGVLLNKRLSTPERDYAYSLEVKRFQLVLLIPSCVTNI